MNNKIVTVLTPNGRRQNVKLEPNSILMQILTEVCNKHNFSSDEYDLKHHRTILDLTQQIRYSGLPNNAQLEMVKMVKPRSNEISNVILGLQLENGSRLMDEFNSNTTLHEILEKLCPDIVSNNQLINETVIVYMRTEISGIDLLKNTTLKNLGLLKGRAMLRIIQRKQIDNPRKIHAITTPLPLKTKRLMTNEIAVKDTPKVEQNIVDESTKEVSCLIKYDEPSIDKSDSLSSITLNSSVEYKKQKIIDDNIVEEMEITESITDLMSNNLEAIEEVNGESDLESEKIIIGERNAILFSLETAQCIADTNVKDVPDSFFDLTVNDLKKILKELKTLNPVNADAPLMTEKMRDDAKKAEYLQKLNLYSTTIIRIQFPERLVLQGDFKCTETIEDVKTFIKQFINESDFHLYTTPPKSILLNESSLIDINCIPRALLHFSCTSCTSSHNNKHIKEEFLTKLSTSIVTTTNKKPIKSTNSDEASNNLMLQDNSILNVLKSSTSSTLSSSSSSSSTKPTTGSENKNYGNDKVVPKWFKPIGK